MEGMTGKSVCFYTGTATWKLKGRLHREDGSAIEYADGSEEWWIDGVEDAKTTEEFRRQKAFKEREEVINYIARK